MITPSGEPGRPWLTIVEDDYSRVVSPARSMTRRAALTGCQAFGLPASVVRVIWAAGGPGQDCDVRPVAMPPGYSWAPAPPERTSANVGSGSVPPGPAWVLLAGGQARRPLWASGRGGAAVVLRAGESPVHGEGRQRDQQPDWRQGDIVE